LIMVKKLKGLNQSRWEIHNSCWLTNLHVALLWRLITLLYLPEKEVFFYCFIIHMCIQGLGHFSPLPTPPPLPPTPPAPSHPYPLNTQQKLFCPYL
jgi:hypothetical protein